MNKKSAILFFSMLFFLGVFLISLSIFSNFQEIKLTKTKKGFMRKIEVLKKVTFINPFSISTHG